MAYLPPVNLPDLSGKNYAGELYGMISGVGEAYYGAKRDKIGDEQWQSEQARAQSNADRNYALELQKFEADKAAAVAGPSEVYGTKVPVQRADGSFGYDLIRKDGTRQPFEPGAGDRFLPDVSWRDTGTEYIPTDKYGQSVPGIDSIPIDNAGRKRAEGIGTGGATAQNALPMIEYQTGVLLGSIDDVINDPNLPYLTDPVGGLVPTWMSTDPGGMAATQAKINQVIGKSFLQAYDALRGAGAITEQEGQAAKEAWTRLTTQTMSDADYLQALMDYRREAAQMLDIARQRATAGQPAAQSQGIPLTTPGGVTFQKVSP